MGARPPRVIHHFLLENASIRRVWTRLRVVLALRRSFVNPELALCYLAGEKMICACIYISHRALYTYESKKYNGQTVPWPEFPWPASISQTNPSACKSAGCQRAHHSRRGRIPPTAESVENAWKHSKFCLEPNALQKFELHHYVWLPFRAPLNPE